MASKTKPKTKSKALISIPSYEYTITLRDVMHSIEKINDRIDKLDDDLNNKIDREIKEVRTEMKTNHRWIIGLVIGTSGLILLNNGLILLKLFMG